MTIAIDATLTQERQKSGMEQYLYNLLTNLIPQKPEIQFILLLFSDAPSTLDEFITQNHPNLTISRIGPMPTGFLNWLSFPFQILPAYLKLKRKFKQVLFYQPFHLRGFYPKILPTIVVMHDLALARFNYYSNKGSLIGKLRKIEYWFHTNRIQQAAAIITPTFFTKQDFLAEYPKCPESKIYVTHLASDVTPGTNDAHLKYLPEGWENRGYLLYQGGGVQASKNSEGVINAYLRFLEILEETKKLPREKAPYLVISGQIFVKESIAATKFREFVKAKGLEANVHFAGKYADEDKWALIKNAFVFIHLSLYEGFGIAILEAMQVGTPVIAHNGTTYPEVAQDCALLVDGTNAQEGAEAILKVYLNKEFATVLGEKGRARALDFSWDRCAKETSEVFKEVWSLKYKVKKA